MESPQDRTECTDNRNAMTLVRRAVVWVACLVVAGEALSHDDNNGWYFSRANCLSANESLTWKIDLTPSVREAAMGQVVPGTGFTRLGIPAYRRSVSIHSHRHVVSKNHRHESSTALVWTWRAHAGSFPQPEAFPYFTVRVGTRLVWVWQNDGVWGINLIPYIQVMFDPTPWAVEGTHYERTSRDADLVVRDSYATGCNWFDTFNSM